MKSMIALMIKPAISANFLATKATISEITTNKKGNREKELCFNVLFLFSYFYEIR